jgi:hypothetical protein
MIGGGYEFWIGKEWSLGFIGRLQYAAASADVKTVDASGATTTTSGVRVSAFEPALLLGLTYH